MRTCVLLPLAALLLAATFASAQATSSFPHLQGLDRIAQSAVSEIEVTSNRRDEFNAKDSSNTQCLTNLQTAGTGALLLCPYIQTYINGAMDSTTFFSKFCNDGCAQLAYLALSPNVQCVSSDASTIYAATQECARRPQCYKGSTLSALQDFNSCFTPLLNTTDIKASGKATVASVCASATTCTTKIATFVSQHSDCLPTGITTTVSQAVSFYNFLCSSPNGMTDTCAWNLRNLGRVSCSGNSNSNSGSSSTCATSDNWCSSSSGSCTSNLTDSRLDSLCTPCLTGYMSYVSALGGDPLQVAAIQNLWCSKASKTSTSYCWNTVGLSVLGLFPTTAGGVASTCAGDSGKCAPRLINAYADLLSTTATATFKSCASYPASYFAFASSCQGPYEASLRTAESYRRTAAIACAANVNGTLCFPLAWSFRNDQCVFAGSTGLCPAGCATSIANNLAAAGCCAPLINNYLQLQSSSYAASYLVAGTQSVAGFNSTITYTFTALYANAGVIDRSQQPSNALAACSNTTALWSIIETPCPASSGAVQRQLSIALAYANLIKNAAAFQKIKQGLRADIANALSLSSDVIRGDDIIENKNLTVKLSASSSRRAAAGGGSGASTTTGSGATYVFSVDAGSNSATAAASFDTLVSGGSLTLTTTASAIVSSCPTCLDASADLSNPLAAVSAGVNAGTTLAPGATATPTTSAPVYVTLPSSSATASATIVSMVAALVAVMMMAL